MHNVERRWERQSGERTVPSVRTWRFASRKPYLRHHGLQVFALILLIAGLDLMLVLWNRIPLVVGTVVPGLMIGGLGGIALGVASWRRDIRRIETDRPLYTFSWRKWFVWIFVLGFLEQLVAILVLPFVPTIDPAILEGTLAVTAVALSASIWTTRVALIARYEREGAVKLMAVFGGSSRFDIRELRVVAERNGAPLHA